MFYSVACVDPYWAISHAGKQCIVNSKDRAFFKFLTEGSTCVCSGVVARELPKSFFKGRKILVLSRSMEPANNVEVFSDFDSLSNRVFKEKRDVFFIGGSSIYGYFAPHCDMAFITKPVNPYLFVHDETSRYHPDLSLTPGWHHQHDLYLDSELSVQKWIREEK